MVSWYFNERASLTFDQPSLVFTTVSTVHLACFSRRSVLSGRNTPSTCHSFAAFSCQVASLLLPPGTLFQHFCARWHVRCFHLSQFSGIFVPGGDFCYPPGTVFRYFRTRWHLRCFHLSQFRGIFVTGGMSAAPTCHSFPVFSCQVATSLFPPVTLFLHFRARWHLHCFHLSQFSSISVPGGVSAAPTCHGFPAFPFQVASLLFPPVTVSRHFRSRWHLRCSHLSQFCGIFVPGGGWMWIVNFRAAG